VGAGVMALAWLSGCYTYVPVESTTPLVGERVAFQITDHGRVGLAERMGTGVTVVEGRVLGMEGDQVVVSVLRVGQINGESSQWSGETVRFDRSYVARAEERQLSKTRTWLAAGLATVAVVALITTTGLGGFFDPLGGDPDPDPDPKDFKP